ncbi:hypothetical protein ACTFIZ_006424 [Dictyostelium cf. discoideum]
MLLNKSLLLLVAFVFAIVSATTTYSEFKITGINPMTKDQCNSSIVYTAQDGACQNVCGMYGKLFATTDPAQFKVDMFMAAGCPAPPMASPEITCLPDEQEVKITETISLVCFADKEESSDSHASTMVASFSAILIALLFSLL